jgi:hypothetical protein
MIFSKFHPGSPEYTAEMLSKARGATIRSNGGVRVAEGTRPTGQAEHQAAMIEKFRASGSKIRSNGLKSVVAGNEEPNG